MESLYEVAVKIQARAIRRCGELLKEVQAQGTRTDLELRDGDVTKLTGGKPVPIYDLEGIDPEEDAE